MSGADSEIIDFYPIDFKIDLNGELLSYTLFSYNNFKVFLEEENEEHLWHKLKCIHMFHMFDMTNFICLLL